MGRSGKDGIKWKLHYFITNQKEKNAKIEMVNIVNKRKNADDVLNTIINQTEKMIGILQKLETKKIIVKSNIWKNFEGLEKECINETYVFNRDFMIQAEKIQFYSIEDFINYIYRIIGFSDSVYTLSLDEVYKNPSIRYFINEYYNGKEGKTDEKTL